MTVFQVALKRNFRDKTNLLFLTLFPIAAIFLPTAEWLSVYPAGYQYFGILLLFVGIRLTAPMLEDRRKGVIKRLAAAPMTHLQYLWQNLLAYAVIMIGQCILVVAGGAWFGHTLYHPMKLFILYVLFSFTALAMALAWNSIYRSSESSFLAYMSLIVLMGVLGGMIMPLDMLPALLQRAAVLFPTYWLYEGMLDIALDGLSTVKFVLACGMMGLYTLFFLVIGSLRRLN